MTVDLRSDTVTLPTEEMLSSMADAEVGDDGRTREDGRSEDPAVRRLEDRSAELTGKQAALFVPSGTFGNTLGALALSRGSDPIWVFERAHILKSEKALFSRGLFGREYREYGEVTNIPVAKSDHAPLLLVENTVSSDAGRPLNSAELEHVAQLKQAGWSIHMDGARLFNAAVGTGESVESIVSSCDTVMFCLSKGLGAPIGSMLCGDRDTIGRSRVLRKQLGGAMRQAGYVAAAGLAALETPNIERLADDHRRARMLHEVIGSVDGATSHCRTNIISVHLSLPVAETVVDMLTGKGYRIRALSTHELRVLTHRGITDEQARLAGEAVADCIVAAAKEKKEI